MVVKRLELCHYQSMEQIVTQTEVIERNFKENIQKIVKSPGRIMDFTPESDRPLFTDSELVLENSL